MNRNCTRKGTAEAMEFLTHLANITVGRFTLNQAVDYFRKKEYLVLWSLDTNAKDAHGLKRALGDLFGRHGLGLTSVIDNNEKIYFVPPELTPASAIVPNPAIEGHSLGDLFQYIRRALGSRENWPSWPNWVWAYINSPDSPNDHAHNIDAENTIAGLHHGKSKLFLIKYNVDSGHVGTIGSARIVGKDAMEAIEAAKKLVMLTSPSAKFVLQSVEVACEVDTFIG